MATQEALACLVKSSFTEVKEEFASLCNTEELLASLHEVIPIPKDKLNVLEVRGSWKKFKAVFECHLRTKSEVQSFIDSYAKLSKETLRQNASPQMLSAKNRYTEAFYFRCHHKTRCQSTMSPMEVLKKHPSQRMKNTNCPFSLVCKLKRTEEEYPCVVTLEWNHNHPIQALQSLSFRDIPQNVLEEINQMYENGYTPGLAYKEFTKLVMKGSKDELEFHIRLADRSTVPRRRDFNNLFTEFNKKKYGLKNIEEVWLSYPVYTGFGL